MIISASRRTDIPAFYADWFINRVRAGFCAVPNPFNAKQISRIHLTPEEVEVIVFWTRNPKPILKYLDELDTRGFRYYFQFTVMANPRELDPKCPPFEESIKTFRALAERLGPSRVLWRYDPIVLSNKTPPDFHRAMFATIAESLKGYTRRAVISVLDIYKNNAARMRLLEESDLHLTPAEGHDFANLIRSMVDIATANAMQVVSCAEEIDLRPFGVLPGKCIDDALIAQLFGLSVTHKKDRRQRKACGCVLSKDIGMYDTCPFNCAYCYATKSLAAVERNRTNHDPMSPSITGWHEPVNHSPSTHEDLQLPLL